MYEHRGYSEVKYSGITINSPGHKKVCIELEKREIFFAIEAPVKPPGEENKIHRRIDLIVFLEGKHVFVEIDGRSNNIEENKRDDDHFRDRLIGRHGRVLRFTHSLALKSPEKVVDMVLDELKHSPYSSTETSTQTQELEEGYDNKRLEEIPFKNVQLVSEDRASRQKTFDDFFPDPDIASKINKALESDNREEAFRLRGQLFESIEKMYDFLGYKKAMWIPIPDGKGSHSGEYFTCMLNFTKRGKGFFQIPETVIFEARHDAIKHLRHRFEALSKKNP